ncbi:MAG: nicotinate-nucleotide--dimethylbenzimidazole phosphoribosyltransferase [Helicobacteraceae bacterium]|jgi:uncharacterized protein (TIGR00303 family)|nr:nicotinate-nucleotide--dimethylbenzimidazole phosphoribosyltransferase [Helicobacteraceae bacterium]
MNILKLSDQTQSSLPAGKADFILAASVTRTCEIEGITQAGIPGKIALTPTLDAEFLVTGKVFSLDNMAETATGIPTPGLLTRAVHTLTPFSAIHIVDLGLKTAPQQIDVVALGLSPSPSITEEASFDAKAVFEKGRAYAKSYRLSGDYVILGESTPSGTTTAQAAIQALGLKTDGLFASSFKESPVTIKEETIAKALAKIKPNMSFFEKLGHTADQTLLFSAGFMLEASKRFHVVLAGGTQMAAALLIADRLSTKESIWFDPRHITLCTTGWIAHDGASNINLLLQQLSFRSKAVYTEFRYEDAKIPVLKLYDEGEAKEGVGAGAAIAYGYMQGLSQQQITARVEALMSGEI